MSSFTLDDIRAAAEKKYASTDITLADGTPVTLLNALKLKSEARARLGKIQDEMSDDDNEDIDHEALISESLVLVAKDKPLARKLLKEIDGDLTLLVTIFEKYTEETEAGEASPSQA